MTTATRYKVTPRHKTGWFEAARMFIANNGEVGNFHKAAASLASFMRVLGLTGTAVSVLDEAGDFIPGLDIITIGDDLLWIYGLYAIVRIWSIRREANRPRIMIRR